MSWVPQVGLEKDNYWGGRSYVLWMTFWRLGFEVT